MSRAMGERESSGIAPSGLPRRHARAMTDRMLFVLAALSALVLVGWRKIPDPATTSRIKPSSEIRRATTPSSPAVRFNRHTNAVKTRGLCGVQPAAMDISYQYIGGVTFYAYVNGQLVASGTTNDGNDMQIDNLDCSATVTIYTDNSLMPTGHHLVQGDWCPGVTYSGGSSATAQITFSGDGDVEQSTFCVS